MVNQNLNDVLSFATLLSVFVMAVVQLVKITINLPKNIVPLVGVLIGLLLGLAFYPFTDLQTVERLWGGGLAGLSATGLFELAFNKRTGNTIVNSDNSKDNKTNDKK
ncbi:holin [Paenibacillus macquariensis]|uniref:Bacteriophage A118-like holin, Hol118 n=1 Tax=Paenibacillus macquariensis TaxID=948756 RepID=A0ABY1JSE3_9BACL|nr:holin [Paenibacillus macquariensis]MEC0092928.1 holin [Paenibacillus macquariensis]OAB36294.1 holin [Paenibacillus macquariensis subsp. macquariensis]SIQ68924.1 Bacteriophage A118-like holin, Hol118 [Paenibacillus macquariensis]